MDFQPSERCSEFTERLTAFMDDHVYPAEEPYERQLREFGGPAGVRDAGALESALGRARNRWGYEGGDLPRLAAAYAFGIARNHPFVDGNKRAALLAIVTFLGLNDIEFTASEAEAVIIIRRLAAGDR